MRKIVELLLNRPPTLRQSFTTFLSCGGDAACAVGAAYLAAGYTYKEFREAANNAHGEWPGTYIENMVVAAGVDPDEKVLLPVNPKGDRLAFKLFEALYRMNDRMLMRFDDIIRYLSDEENWYHDNAK